MSIKKSSEFIDFTQTIRYGGNTSFVGQIVEFKKSRDGKPMPNYKTRIALGMSATTVLSAFTHECLVWQPGMVRWDMKIAGQEGKTYLQTYCGINPAAYTAIPIPSKFIEETVRSIASIKVRKKISSETQAYSGLAFLGEIRETIHQIRHPAEAAFALTEKFAVRADRLRRKRQARKISKRAYADAIAGSWIEFCFGLAPVISDIGKIAASALQMIEDKRLLRLTGSGKQSDSSSACYTTGYGGDSLATFYKDDVDEYTHKYTVGYRREVNASNNALRNVISLGGFELSEIIPTAWELLPWSFFIDYFSNIGKCIEADLVSMEDVAWTNSTKIYERTRIVHSLSVSPSMYNSVTLMKPPLCVIKYRQVYRDDSWVAFPSLRFQLPGQTGQFLNMAALAVLVTPQKKK